MKYWLFDGKDAQGPFEAEELKRLSGFGPESLICPDGADTAEQWRPSQYYLIKPPPTKAESIRQARAAPAVSRGMGRIAEAGIVEEAPAPVPARQPLPERRRTSSAALLTAAVALAASAGAYYYLNRQKLLAPKIAAPAAAPPQAAPAPPSEPPVSQAQIADVTSFIENFKAQSPGRKLPQEPVDVFSPGRWKAPKTVGEALTARSLLALDAAAASLMEKQGLTPARGERELRKNSRRWNTYAERFLKAVSPLNWDVAKSKDCPTQTSATGEPTCFTAAALLRTQRDGPQERHAFLADLTTRTLKPLDSNAWLDVDPKGLAAWGQTHIAVGQPIDEDAVAAQAPIYGIPLEHRQHLARHAVEPQEQEEQATDDGDGDQDQPQAPPAQKPADQDQGLDYTEPGQGQAAPKQTSGSAADDQALEKALLDQPSTPAQPQAQSANAPAAVPPGLDHAVSAPPQATPSQPSDSSQAPTADSSNGSSGGNKGKSAMDMNVDELQKYLNRGSGSTP